MIADCFLDTNILVYAATGRGEEELKRKHSLELIQTKQFGLSAQVLQEFFVIVTRKIDVPLSTSSALEWIEQFEAFPIISIDKNLVKTSIELSEKYLISYWDGAIIAAAQSLQANVLYTEDLNAGQSYDDVVVVNPFHNK